MIKQLVSSIIEDPPVAAQIKPRIQRLGVPLLNAAMSDQEFFSAPDHPARQVLNQLGRVTSNADGCLKSTVERAISAAVEHVVHESTHDVGAYSHAAKQIERVIADQASRRKNNLSKVIHTCEAEQGGLVTPADEANVSPRWGQWLNWAKRLDAGDTVILNNDTEQAQRTALAWVGQDHATYVFVDDQGIKASTVSLQELATQTYNKGPQM
jgi:hypothetical protein